MIKRIITFVLVFTMVASVCQAALPVPDNSEVIEFTIKSVELNEIKKSNFEKIDLRPYANRSFVDNVAGDMTGGWSDQGPDNDMRNFDLYGDVEILGIPFSIIPQGENNGKSVLAIRGKDNMELPKRVEIPYNKKTAGAYLLQSAPYAFSAGHYVGRYSFEYTDGTVAYTDVISSQQISDFFGSGVPAYGKRAWLGDNKYASENGYKINCSMFALKNPHPDKIVKNLVLETEGNSSFIMIVGITFTDRGPYYLQDGDIALNPDTEDWKKIENRNSAKSKGTALDVSYLLDAPAGKHGYLISKGESFYFEDGTKAKFWGTNLYGKANFPEKEEAEKLASEIAQNGFNIVRMTNLDGYIFDGKENSAEFPEDKMDKLCYFIKCLKDKGVYVYLTVTSNRPALKGDGIENVDDVENGYKIEGFFDENLINLQQNYIEKLLNYNNKYTATTIGKDPVVAMIEYMDSNSMFLLSSNPRSEYGISADLYYNKLNSMFNQFIAKKYRAGTILKKAWVADYGTEIEKNFNRLSVNGGWQNSPIIGIQHKADLALFMTDVHNGYYAQMESAVRKCGFKGVTTSHSNGENELELGDTYSSSHTDFIAVNAFSAVNMGIGKNTNPAVYDEGIAYIDDLIKARINGKPFVVSGYNTGVGAKFTGDTYLALAAVSGQQGWSALQYYFTDGEDNPNNAFEIQNSITRLGLMPAASILYNGIEELDEGYVAQLPISSLISTEYKKLDINHILNKKVSVSVKQNNAALLGTKDNKNKYVNKMFKFDSEKHIYSIKTKNTEGCVGVLSESESFDHISYHFQSPICAAVLSALDNKNLDNAERYLLTTAGRSKSEGMSVDEWFNVTAGKEMLTEPVTGSVVLKLGNVKVYALDFSGQRLWEMKQYKDSKGNIIVPITEDNSAFYYEIVKDRG